MGGQSSHPVMSSRQRMTVLATGLGVFMVFVDVNIVNVALPSIQAVYHTGEQGLQWAVAGYSLGMAAVLMSCALLGDRYGRRRGFLVGVAVFGVASVVCALPVSLGLFTLARVVQGVGAAFMSVLSLALLSHAFPDPGLKARAIAGWMAIGCIGAASAPALGGFLVEGLGWRSVFAVNVPFGALVWLPTLVGVDESEDPDPTQLDWPGQLMFAPAIAVIAYAIIEAPRVHRQPAVIAVLLLVAVVLLWLFVRHERRAAFPLIDLHLFTHPVYRSALLAYFLVMSCYFGTLMVLTQHFQNVRGFSPLHAGLVMLPVPVGFGVASLLAGRVVESWGARLPVLTCLAAMIAGLVLFALAIGRMLPVVVIGLTVFGAGSGGCATPLLHLGMTEVDDHRAGMAAGLINLQRSLGSIFGVAFLGSILAAWLSATLPARLDDVIPDPAERAAVVAAIVDSANPRAHPAHIGPARPITSAQERLVVRTADKDFIRGVQLAIGAAAAVLTGALVLGVRRFPRAYGGPAHGRVTAAPRFRLSGSGASGASIASHVAQPRSGLEPDGGRSVRRLASSR
ncbi:putative MFS-type transporter [Mycobacterium lacus]|uniref:Putative MFS-type transporter n=2 Tax=Mycobacterium lacus TaxID=169765 RepID=A0A7I7NFK1_9MYCO|nr:putative MFS-type transporter [Mycobacterium lacus]